MRRSLTVFLALTLVEATALASPEPLEDMLVRAKNALISEVSSTNDTVDSFQVSFHVVSDLRGNLTKEFLLTDRAYPTDWFKKGSQWLLLSQGDNRYGEPPDIIGSPDKGQFVWCGWIALPLFTVNKKTYAGGIFSFCDGMPFNDLQTKKNGVSLDLSRIKRLIQRYPYNPNINR